MLSSQRLWPRSWSRLVGVVMLSCFHWRGEEPGPLGAGQCGYVIFEQVSDPVDADVGRWVAGENVPVSGVVSLADEDGGHPQPPGSLDRGEEVELVVHHHVVFP